MGFDVNNFVNQAEKSIVSRAVGQGSQIASRTISSLSSKVLGAGGTSALGQIIGNTVDKVLQSASDDFFSSIFQQATSKSKNRTNQNSIDQYIQKTNPSTKTVTGQRPSLRFPADLGKYFCSMVFQDYQRPAPGVTGTTTNSQTIYFPFPRVLDDSHQVIYETPALGLVGNIADTIQQMSSGSAGAGQGGAGSVAAGKAGIKAGLAASNAAVAAKNAALAAARSEVRVGTSKLIAMTAAASVNQEITAALEQSVGAALNPNQSVVFKGPALRSFVLQWEFSPNNPAESKTLKEIIKEIRKRMLPSMTYAQSTGILSYPQVVEVSLHPNDLIKRKKALIQSCEISYSPQGIPSFFKGTNEPTFIALSLSLVEIEYFLSEDFGGADLYRSKDGKGMNADLAVIGQQLYDLGKSTVADVSAATNAPEVKK